MSVNEASLKVVREGAREHCARGELDRFRGIRGAPARGRILKSGRMSFMRGAQMRSEMRATAAGVGTLKLFRLTLEARP